MEQKESLLKNEPLIESEAVEVPVVENEKIPVKGEVKQTERELEKIAAADQEPLKTKSVGKKWGLMALFVCVNVAAILGTALLEFTGGDAPVSISAVWNTYVDNRIWLYGLIAVFAISVLFNALKRYTLFKSTLKKRLPLISLNSTVVCRYYDSITPLGSGGQPFEIYYLRKKGVPVGIASGVPIASYCLDRIAFVIVALGSVLWQGFGDVSTIIKILFVIGIIVNAFIPFAILFFTIMPKVAHAMAKAVAKAGHFLHLIKNEEEFYKKTAGSILEYAECLKYFMHKSLWRSLLGAAFSVLSLTALYSCPYFILRMHGVHDVSWIKILSLTSICYVSVTLLPTPGNSGGAEFSFRSIFASYLTGGVLFWGMICWRIVSYYLYILCGCVLFLIQQIFKLTKRGKKEQATIDAALKREKERRAAEYAVLYGNNKQKEEEELSIPTPNISDDDAQIYTETTLEPLHETETLGSHTTADGATAVAEFTAVISGEEMDIDETAELDDNDANIASVESADDRSSNDDGRSDCSDDESVRAEEDNALTAAVHDVIEDEGSYE